MKTKKFNIGSVVDNLKDEGTLIQMGNYALAGAVAIACPLIGIPYLAGKITYDLLEASNVIFHGAVPALAMFTAVFLGLSSPALDIQKNSYIDVKTSNPSVYEQHHISSDKILFPIFVKGDGIEFDGTYIIKTDGGKSVFQKVNPELIADVSEGYAVSDDYSVVQNPNSIKLSESKLDEICQNDIVPSESDLLKLESEVGSNAREILSDYLSE